MAAQPDELIDETAVELALAGNIWVGLTAAEMRVVFDRLNGEGLGTKAIAEIMGTNRRQVQRWRSGDAGIRGRVADPTRRLIVRIARLQNELAGERAGPKRPRPWSAEEYASRRVWKWAVTNGLAPWPLAIRRPGPPPRALVAAYRQAKGE